MSRKVVVEFVGKDTSAGSTAADVDSKFGKLGGTLGKVGLAATAAFATAGLAAGKFSLDAIGAASNMNETIAKVGTIFGKDRVAGMEEWAGGAAKALGQSKQQALDAAATFAIFGKSAGLSGRDLSGFSTQFTALASDMASFHNTSPEEAIEAIGSALRGEAEPIRKYGVLLDDATLKAEAMKLGLISTTKEALTPQQKVLAAQAAIYAQTKDAQHDFMRTSDGLANQQRQLSAQFENVKASLGEKLLPIALKVVTFMNKDFGPALKKVGEWAQEHLLPPLRDFAEKMAPKVRDLMDKVKQAFSDARPFFDLVGQIFTNVLVPVFKKFAEIYLPYLGFQIGLIGKAFGVLGDAGIWLWNNAIGPTIKFMLSGFAAASEAWAAMLRGLSHVPGFGWARDAAATLEEAGRRALGLRDSINRLDGSRAKIYVDWIAPAPPRSPTGTARTGFATGTRSAPAGWAKVGEHGPELMRMAGGEQVFTAQQTRNIMQGDNGGGGTYVVQLAVEGRVIEQVLIERARTTGRPLQVRTLGPT